MRFIKTISLLFLSKSMYFNSYRAWIIFFNGIAYHGYETVDNYNSKKTSLLRYNDIFCNFIITLYTMYYYPISRPYAITGTIHFIMLCAQHILTKTKKTYHANILEDFMHVFMVQLPLFKGLELSMNHQRVSATKHLQTTPGKIRPAFNE